MDVESRKARLAEYEQAIVDLVRRARAECGLDLGETVILIDKVKRRWLTDVRASRGAPAAISLTGEPPR